MFASRALFLFALTFLVLSLVHCDSVAATVPRMRAPDAGKVKLRQFSYKNPDLRIRKAGASISSSMSPSPTPSSSISSITRTQTSTTQTRITTTHTQTSTTHRRVRKTTDTPAPPATSQPTPG